MRTEYKSNIIKKIEKSSNVVLRILVVSNLNYNVNYLSIFCSSNWFIDLRRDIRL